MIDFTTLNYVDYTVFFIICFSTVFAFFRGFIGSFLSLAGWVLSVYLSYLLFPDLKPYIETKIKNPLVVLIVGHTGLLLIFLIIFGIFNLFATTAVASMTKGIIDRSLGAAFGITRGAIIASFLFLAITTSIAMFNGTDQGDKADEETIPPWLKDAASYKYLKFGKTVLAEIIPDSFYNRIEEVYEDISKKTMDERFIDSTAQKLRKQLPSKVTQQLDRKNDESSLHMSEEDLETKKAEDLMRTYKALKDSQDSSGNPAIPDEELDRLEDIITNRQAKTP